MCVWIRSGVFVRCGAGIVLYRRRSLLVGLMSDVNCVFGPNWLRSKVQ